jgi:predicted alpha/beta hydrolase family esterase
VSLSRPLSISNPVLVLPGYGGSGPAHWQTLWEKAHSGFTRVEEKDWDAPDCAEWVDVLETAVRRSGPDTVLVAHSLACLQVAHWAAHGALPAPPATRPAPIRAAFLVAPPDPQAPAFPAAARGFSPVPLRPFPFPSLVIGSTNDPYAAPAFGEACARAWGARFVSAGPLGHINADSALGEWDEGKRLLESLLV